VVSQPAARIAVEGVEVRIESVQDALASGIAYTPEDRRSAGVFSELSVATNLAMASLDRVSRWGIIRRREQSELAERYREVLDVRCRSVDQPLGTLSGGNQQKVMIGRWLASDARVLVMEEPTQGVDIGARSEIHRLLRGHAQTGGAVIFLSSDLDELVDLADQIAVIRHGELVELIDNGGKERVSHDYLVAKGAGLGPATRDETG
jgi:ABC-type sugar transport system ATPase subunit